METDAQLVIEAANIVGSQANLARKVKESPSFINQIATGRKTAPDLLCVKIEIATDGIVSRKRFRPNNYHEMWPELADPS